MLIPSPVVVVVVGEALRLCPYEARNDWIASSAIVLYAPVVVGESAA